MHDRVSQLIFVWMIAALVLLVWPSFAAAQAQPAQELVMPARWQAAHKQLRLATWNIEYLISSETHHSLSSNCVKRGDLVDGRQRLLPCAIALRPTRNAADLAALRKYANRLNADVIALQEVDGPEVAATVFPGYDFCFTQRANVQKNGFAIRRGLPFRCEKEYTPLSLVEQVRRGVVVTVLPNTANQMRLMSVHLKSGCPEEPLTSDSENCRLLSEQIKPLEAWIDTAAKRKERFAVLGDFNRRFSLEGPHARDTQGRSLAVWPEIDDADPPDADLLDISSDQAFVKCSFSDPYLQYIDTILIGRRLSGQIIDRSFSRVAFDSDDVNSNRWLSDHCPVAIDLKLK